MTSWLVMMLCWFIIQSSKQTATTRRIVGDDVEEREEVSLFNFVRAKGEGREGRVVLILRFTIHGRKQSIAPGSPPTHCHPQIIRFDPDLLFVVRCLLFWSHKLSVPLFPFPFSSFLFPFSSFLFPHSPSPSPSRSQSFLSVSFLPNLPSHTSQFVLCLFSFSFAGCVRTD